MQKIVMPKVFDEFAKRFNLEEQQGAGNALEEVLSPYPLDLPRTR